MDQSSIDRHNLRRQLQRFVINTIRVMAWPERAYLTAHAAKTSPGKSPSVSSCELFRCFNKYMPSKLASIQFRRTPPMPSHKTTQGGPFSFLFYLCASPSISAFRWRGGNNPNSKACKPPTFRQYHSNVVQFERRRRCKIRAASH